MISLIKLQRALNRLHKAQERGDNQDKDGNPEGVPVNPVAAVIPPLAERLWRRVVVGLLENYQTVAPEVETLDLSILPFGVPQSAR